MKIIVAIISIFVICKGGHSHFKSAPPPLRNIAYNQIDYGIADSKTLRNCNCGPSKFDFRNSATLCSLLLIPLLSSPFSSAQGGCKKSTKNIFSNVCLYGNQKLVLKGQLHDIFDLQFFFHESIHTLNHFDIGLIHEKNRERNSCATVTLNAFNSKKHLPVKIYNFKLLHGQKYAENCGSEALKLRNSDKNCDCGIAELRLLLKIAELRLRNCDCGL